MDTLQRLFVYTIHTIIPTSTPLLGTLHASNFREKANLRLAGRGRHTGVRGAFKAREYGDVILPLASNQIPEANSKLSPKSIIARA
jgi:hypothetical protein